ncbi:MAG TPA: alpha/beta hydrolase, partial [Candidatus Limnocylindrales bacterium]|nr:alpha/beta hydrolase [Candidatus Limnocylindrales bacterium]
MNELAFRTAERRVWRSIGVRPIERRIHLERIGVDVRVQELGQGPPVLFIHGLATSGVSWAGLAARAEGFRCLILDRPGTGLSQPLGRPVDPATLASLADVLVADVLDAFGLPSAHLVASSFGGYVALRSAAATPERIERMVQFSWPVGAPTPTLPLFLRAMSLPGFRRLVEALPRTDRTMRLLFHRLGHGDKLLDGRISREDLACYVALMAHTDTLRNEFAPARALISPLRGLARLHLPDDVLRRVACPTLFIWGGRDPFGGAAVGRALVERIPSAMLDLMAEAGHSPWLDDMAGSVAKMTAFLGQDEPRSRGAPPA